MMNDQQGEYPQWLPQPPYNQPPLQQNDQLPQQVPISPPKKKTNIWLIILVVVVLVVIFGAIVISLSNQTASSLTPDATQSTGQTQSIPDQLRQALPSLNSADTTIIESGGDVFIQLSTSSSPTLDNTLTAITIISTDEKHVWQTNISGIHTVTITVAGVDGSGGTLEFAKATVTEHTASALSWDSLSAMQAWSQFDKTWTIGYATPEYGN